MGKSLYILGSDFLYFIYLEFLRSHKGACLVVRGGHQAFVVQPSAEGQGTHWGGVCRVVWPHSCAHMCQ